MRLHGKECNAVTYVVVACGMIALMNNTAPHV